jgi:hypothetical protein
VQGAGGILRRTLHDRFIGPAMGWTRNYHGYVFRDVVDGAVFGPENSTAIDMMHMTDFYVRSVPDTQTTLAQLVQSSGMGRLDLENGSVIRFLRLIIRRILVVQHLGNTVREQHEQ